MTRWSARRRQTRQQVKERDTAFLARHCLRCASAAILPKTDAFACGGAAERLERTQSAKEVDLFIMGLSNGMSSIDLLINGLDDG